ncbi:MAG: sigma-70 family RNA polymerase sigma factor [Thermoleophilia bacterium]
MSASLPPIFAEPAPREISESEIKTIAVKASRNDPEAFTYLYRLYFSQVFTFINFRVSNREDAEDLANTVFEKALSAIDRYRPKPAQFSTWLYTIAKNCIIDHYRKRRLPMDDEAEAAGVPADDCHTDPEKSVLLEERKRTLREALTELTDEQREVVECRFFFELSILETAELMGKTEGAVKALQFRALDNLHRLLTEDILAL